MAPLAEVLTEADLGLHRSWIVSTRRSSWRSPRPQHSGGRSGAAATTAPTPLELLCIKGVLADARGTDRRC